MPHKKKVPTSAWLKFRRTERRWSTPWRPHPPHQTEVFWQTYWEYRGKVKRLTDRVVKLVKQYEATSYAAVDDATAVAIVEEILAVEIDRAETCRGYSERLGEILIPKQPLRWVQTEMKMNAAIALEAAAVIPLDR